MWADFQRLADILLREAAAEFEDYPGLEADLALGGVQLQRRLGERASEDGRIGERYETPCQREYSYRRHHDHPPRHVCSLLPAPLSLRIYCMSFNVLSTGFRGNKTEIGCRLSFTT